MSNVTKLNHDVATIGKTDHMSITGGFFPVGNSKAVEKLMKQRNDNQNAKEGKGRSLVSPLMISDGSSISRV